MRDLRSGSSVAAVWLAEDAGTLTGVVEFGFDMMSAFGDVGLDGCELVQCRVAVGWVSPPRGQTDCIGEECWFFLL